MENEIRSRNETYSVSWLVGKDADERLNKGIALQRGSVWTLKKQSDFIVSLLRRYPVENLLFEESEDETFLILDGLQRITTICNYVNGKFKLTKIEEPEYKRKNIEGKSFGELSPEFRKRIEDFQLTITILEKLDQKVRARIFWARNQGQPLSNIDLTPVVLGEDLILEYRELCKHKFFTETIRFTKIAVNKRTDLKILIQYMILSSGEDTSFSGSDILKFCEKYRNRIDLKKIESLMDYLTEAITPNDPNVRKTVNLPVVMMVGERAKAEGIKPKEFEKRITEFFRNVPQEYEATKIEGSAKKSNVQTRLKVLSETILD